MSEALYHKAILDHARAAVGAGSLAAPDGAATVDNPVCGDRVTVEIDLADGAVGAVAHRVRGCVLCEAAASVLAGRAPGLTPDRVRAAADGFARMIRNGGPTPPGWPELEAFAPVRAAKSRHDCVLLPFQAAERALDAAAAPPER